MFLLRRELSVLSILAGLTLSSGSSHGETKNFYESQDSSASKTYLAFDVSTVKPTNPNFTGWQMNFTVNGFIARGVNLNALVQEAYAAYEPGCFKGASGWAAETKFDVYAKIDPRQVQNYARLSLADRRTMLQQLLIDRFGLSTHVEHTRMKVLVLSVADGDFKVTRSSSPTDQSDNRIQGYESLVTVSSPGHLEGKNFTLEELAKLLETSEQRIIVANPNQIERFDFKLSWAPDSLDAGTDPDHVGNEREYSGGTDSLSTALHKQLGLALIPDYRLVDVVVVDNVKKPTPN